MRWLFALLETICPGLDFGGRASQPPAAQGFQPLRGAVAAIALGCGDARKFIPFLAFGLTLCVQRLTVTVRNHYYQQPSGQGAKRHAI
jgi:hypothetical protein